MGRRLVSAILADKAPTDTWIEPFVGAAGVSVHASSIFGRLVLMDSHQDLILMWKMLMLGWLPPEDPIDRQQYNELKTAEPSAMRGFVGFGSSYGGKWFGGYCAHRPGMKYPYPLYTSSRNSLIKKVSQLRPADVEFRHARFGDYTPGPGSTVYCDPPYPGLTGYRTDAIDPAYFGRIVQLWADSGCFTYVSGFSPPSHCQCVEIFSHPMPTSMSRGSNRPAVERLYRVVPTDQAGL